MRDKRRFGMELIDMKKSVIDKEKSDEKQGVYHFKKKVLYDRLDNPEYVYKWVQTRAENIQKWQYSNKAEFVKAGDEVYPAPFGTNADGNYQYPGGDLVLMKIPIDVWVEKKKTEKIAAAKEAASAISSFEKMVGKEKGARLTRREKEELGL